MGEPDVGAHESIGGVVAASGIDRLVVVGSGALGVATGAAASGGGTVILTVSDVDSAIAAVRAEIRPGDVVLVKASRSVGLERVALALTEEPR